MQHYIWVDDSTDLEMMEKERRRYQARGIQVVIIYSGEMILKEAVEQVIVRHIDECLLHKPSERSCE